MNCKWVYCFFDEFWYLLEKITNFFDVVKDQQSCFLQFNKRKYVSQIYFMN